MDEVWHPQGTQILKRLGTGTHASVYLLQLSPQQVCAFKLYHKATDEIVRQAVREQKFLYYMSNHPFMEQFVPKFINFSEEPLFIQMEYIEGSTLQVDQLTDQQVAFIAKEFEQFSSYLHMHFNMVLRDVSPRNVILQNSGSVKFIDFEQVTEVQQEYQYFGTPRYAAPSSIASHRDDLLSFALILSEQEIQLPWRNLRDLDKIVKAKELCLHNCKKYFSCLQCNDIRKWIFDYYNQEDDLKVSAFIDYCYEFKDTLFK